MARVFGTYVYVADINTQASTYGRDALSHADLIWQDYRDNGGPQSYMSAVGTITTHIVARCGYNGR
jgi:hypothetical protein